MPGRTVTATLRADIGQYVASMSRAGAATQAFASKSSAAVSKNRQGINDLSRDAGLIGAGLAVGTIAAVKSFATFDSAISSVAATGADARANLAALRETAIQAGAATKYSATEAASGIEELLKAGVGAKDVLGGGLTGALNLAATGNLSVGDSASAAATAMKQFGLQGSDVTQVADRFAQVAGTAQGEVSDVAQAFKNGGLTAAKFGLSLDETSQTLAVLASNGILGAEAGTKLSSSLINLYTPLGQGKKALDELSISTSDAQGNLLPIGQVLDTLKQRLSGLDESARQNAIARIFGKENITAGLALLDQGSAGLAKAGQDFEKFGTAADVARTKMDNLNGDLETLRGSFDTALIGLGAAGDGPLRSLVQGATDAVNAFNDLGDGTKSAALAAGAGLASIALGAAGIGKVAVFANEAKGALKGLGISAKTAGIATAGIGAAVGLAALALGAYAAKAAESRARVEDFTTALQSQTDAIQANVTATAAKQLSDNGGLAAAQSLGLGLDVVTQAALGNAQAYKQVEAAVIAARAAGENSSDVDTLQRASDANVLAAAVRGTGAEYNKAVAEAQQFAEATGKAAGSAGVDEYAQAAGALSQMGTSAGSAAVSLDDLASSLFAVNNAALATSNAQIAFEQAVDAAADAAKKNGENLKLSTAAGRDNQTALNGLAATSQKYVESLVEQGKSAKTVEDATRTARSAFIENATAMGLSSSKAKALADQYGLIPKDVKTKVEANTGKSQENLAQINAALRGLPKDVQTEVKSAYKKGGIEAAKAKLAELKDKTVTAGTKSDTKGAQATKNYMGGLRDKAITAGTKSDLSGARKTQAGVNAVKGKTVTVGTRADTSGARTVQSAVNRVTGKTVTIRVTTIKNTVQNRDTDKADGGLITSLYPRLADGGHLIRGRGGPREDNIVGVDRRTGMQTSMVSVGEMVTNARSTAANYSGLQMINAGKGRRFKVTPLAGGGLAGLAAGGLATGGLVNAEILRLIAALNNPLADIATAAAALAKSNSKLGKPAARKARADKAYESAKDRQETLRDRVTRLAREAAATKGTTKADRELKKARLDLAAANAKVSKTSREKTAATKAYNAVAGPSKDATKQLADAQKALAESARSVSDQFADQYRSTSTDAQDWIELMQTGASSITGFTQQILALRKQGLNETLVQQIIGMGAYAGGEIASQIAVGGKALVTSLNQANNSLQQAADALGYTGVGAPKRYATGGLVVGPGTGTSDSVAAPWLSNGEWVVPARAVPANRPALEAMTYGRNVRERSGARSHYAGGGMVRLPSIDMGVVRGALAGMRIEGEMTVHQDRGWISGVVVDVMGQQTSKAGTRY